MAGPETPELAEAAVEGGADLLEIGFPFSDPLADGPVIRLAGRAGARAGDADAGVPRVPGGDARARRRAAHPDDYASILEAYGYERFAADAEAAGATSLIVADLPIEAAPELRARAARRADDDRRADPRSRPSARTAGSTSCR